MFLTDLLIGLSYVGISLTLYSLVRQTKIRFSTVVLWFGIFIGACGATHFMEIWTLWNPDYWLAAGIKVITAVASVATCAYLLKHRPAFIELTLNMNLSELRRKDLEKLNLTLEDRVRSRTEAAEQSEARLKTVTNAVPALISYIDADERYRSMNDAYERWWGVDPQKTIGVRLVDVLGESLYRRVNPHVAKALGGTIARFETEVYFPKVGQRDVEVTYIPDFSKNGKVVGFTVLVMDMTERVQTENALKLSEQKFSMIFENSTFPIALLSMPDARLVDVNPAWCELFEFSRDEVIGKTSAEIGITRQHEVREATLTRILKEGGTRHAETHHATKSGRELVIRSSSDVVRMDGATYILASMEDVTVQRANQLELERHKVQLEEGVRARDQFLSVASHELKTPLTALLLQTQIHRRNIDRRQEDAFEPVKMERYMRQAEKQVSRLNRLVEDMLDVARIQTGVLTIQREWHDLTEVTKEMIERFSPAFLEAGISLVLDSDDGVEGNFDVFRIEQVISNLLTNALKYGDRKPVHVSLRRATDGAILTVRDEGKGVSEAVREKIFDRFERAVSSSEVSGLGLGLFITRQIVEAHGGHVRVVSDGLGKGSTFEVFLPILQGGMKENPLKSNPDL